MIKRLISHTVNSCHCGNTKYHTNMQAIFFTVLFAAIACYVNGAATSHHQSTKELVGTVSKKCAAEHKVSAEHAKLAFNQELPKDESQRCYLECVYKGVGVLNEDAFSLEGSKRLIAVRFHDHKESGLATRLVETCSKEVVKKEGEKCSLGRAVRECFVHHGKEVNFFPTA